MILNTYKTPGQNYLRLARYALSLTLVLAFFPNCYLKAQSVFNKDWKITSLSLTEQWELDSANSDATFRIKSYRPIYVTAGRWSSNPNTFPRSENPDYTVTEPVSYKDWEAKFQLSFKSKVWDNVFKSPVDLWATFTQIAHWQLYNRKISRPFRELNYEAEILSIAPADMNLAGFKMRMIGGGFSHESNGRSLPLSRSWNRIIFLAALELKNWQIILKPWIILPDKNDQNPEVANYIGRGEITVNYEFRKQVIYAVIRHPFNRFDRGSLQLNYVFPVKGNLRLQLQLFTGYGETLIDYNHRQTTIGLGISFVDW